MSDDELEEIVINLDDMEDEADDDDWDDGIIGYGWDDKLGWHDLGLTRAERDRLREEQREDDRESDRLAKIENDAITPTEWMGAWMTGWDRELRLTGRKLTVPMVRDVWIAGMIRYSDYYGLGLKPGRVKHWSGGSKYPSEPPLAFGLHCPFGHRLPAPDDYDYASVRFIVRDDGYVKLWTVERATCTQCHPQLMDDWLTLCQRCEDGIESDLHKAGHPRFEHLPRPTGRFTFGTEVYGDTSPFAFVLHELKRMHELAWAERIIFEGDTNGMLWSTARGILAERAKVQPNRSTREITSGTTPKVKIEWTDASVIAWLLANGVTPEMSGKAAWRVAGPIPGHPPRTRVFAVQPRPTEA